MVKGLGSRVSQNSGILLSVLIIRIVVFCGLHMGCPIYNTGDDTGEYCRGYQVGYEEFRL